MVPPALKSLTICPTGPPRLSPSANETFSNLSTAAAIFVHGDHVGQALHDRRNGPRNTVQAGLEILVAGQGDQGILQVLNCGFERRVRRNRLEEILDGRDAQPQQTISKPVQETC